MLTLNKFLTEWTSDLKSIPIGPLGVIAMAGCEDMGRRINSWLLKWNSLQEVQDEEYYTEPDDDFLEEVEALEIIDIHEDEDDGESEEEK